MISCMSLTARSIAGGAFGAFVGAWIARAIFIWILDVSRPVEIGRARRVRARRRGDRRRRRARGGRQGLTASGVRDCAARCDARSRRSTSSPPRPTAATRSPSCSTATASTTDAMQRFAHWTNLSETTFVLPPTHPEADYRVRIFTPTLELPFAGHPTLGTCHAWLEAGGQARDGDRIVQECGAGLVPVRRTEDGLAFAAPPLMRAGPGRRATLVRNRRGCSRIDRDAIVDAAVGGQRAGLGRHAAGRRRGRARAAPRADRRPRHRRRRPAPAGRRTSAFELRAFFPEDGVTVEDPVTGSLNASRRAVAARAAAGATAPYVASQGTALGRAGRVHVTQRRRTAAIWVAGRDRHLRGRRGPALAPYARALPRLGGVSLQRGVDGAETPSGTSPSRGSTARTSCAAPSCAWHLGTGTLACPRCDAPVALGAAAAPPPTRSPARSARTAARVRDFLSLADAGAPRAGRRARDRAAP